MLAIELLAAAQAYDLQENEASRAAPTDALRRYVRERVPAYHDDRPLADDIDAVFDAQGRAVAGSGRSHTDQAELGDFLLGQISLGATGSTDYSALGG